MSLTKELTKLTKTTQVYNNGEKIFLLYLIAYCSESKDGTYKSSAVDLADEMQMSYRTIQRIVHNLRERGVIRVYSTTNVNGGICANVYEIVEV